MKDVKPEADIYFDRGVNYQHAWEILQQGCEIPPSLEVFEQQLIDLQKKERSIAPVHVATRIVNVYHRIPWPG